MIEFCVVPSREILVARRYLQKRCKKIDGNQISYVRDAIADGLVNSMNMEGFTISTFDARYSDHSRLKFSVNAVRKGVLQPHFFFDMERENIVEMSLYGNRFLIIVYSHIRGTERTMIHDLLKEKTRLQVLPGRIHL